MKRAKSRTSTASSRRRTRVEEIAALTVEEIEEVVAGGPAAEVEGIADVAMDAAGMAVTAEVAEIATRRLLGAALPAGPTSVQAAKMSRLFLCFAKRISVRAANVRSDPEKV